MNPAFLVLRIIPGLLPMGHGLQKLVPPGYSPPLLHAAGRRGSGAGFESLGIRPAVTAAVLAGSAELAAGFLLAAGLLTPIGTVLVGAVMITASLKVHAPNGSWAAEGGFEFPLVLLTVGFAITALGPGSLSVDSWLGIELGRHQLDHQPRCALGDRAGHRPRRRPGGGPGILGVEAHPDPREPAGGTLMPSGGPVSIDRSPPRGPLGALPREDTADEMVFRSADSGYPFPRSRGRQAFELRPDGSYVGSAPGPADKPEPSEGTWALEGGNRLALPDRVLEVTRGGGRRAPAAQVRGSRLGA